MDQKLLAFAGKKQAGKDTAANFVVGYAITQLGRQGFPNLPTHFRINEEGELLVNSAVMDIDGNTIIGDGLLDLNRKDDDYVYWASNCMWPYVKTYAYANILKTFATIVFNLPEEAVYGTDQDKRKLTHIKWKDMCAFLPPRQVSSIKKAGKYDSKMSVREFLQYFGTNICRRLYSECWTQSCLKNIIVDGSSLAIISDCRFENEVRAVRQVGGKVVKLQRSPFKDFHDSETGLDKLNSKNFDLIVPPDVSIVEKNQLILDAMYSWGWFSEHISKE